MLSRCDLRIEYGTVEVRSVLKCLEKHVMNGNTDKRMSRQYFSALYLHTLVLSVGYLYLWDTQEVGGATLAAPVAVVGGIVSKSTVALSPAVLVVVVPNHCKQLASLYSQRSHQYIISIYHTLCSV